VTTARSILRGAAARALVALLVGPSAHADAPAQPAPATGHTSNEWLMMGRNCGASIS